MTELFGIPIGGTPQHDAFRERQTKFVDVYLEPLGRLLYGIIDRPGKLDFEKRLLYGLGRLVIEDFTEVVVNCANGLTTGAMKIQRGMYERTVTLVYLASNPAQIESFYKYFHIAEWKKVQEAHRLFPSTIPDETYEEKKQLYESVKGEYIISNCRLCRDLRKKALKPKPADKKAKDTLQPGAMTIVGICTHERVNHTWSELDVVAMSEKLPAFRTIRFLAYYTNMEETHSTVASVLRRFTYEEGSGFWYTEGTLPEYEGTVLLLAHYLVIFAADVLRDRVGDGQPDDSLWKTCLDHLEQHAVECRDRKDPGAEGLTGSS